MSVYRLPQPSTPTPSPASVTPTGVPPVATTLPSASTKYAYFRCPCPHFIYPPSTVGDTPPPCPFASFPHPRVRVLTLGGISGTTGGGATTVSASGVVTAAGTASAAGTTASEHPRSGARGARWGGGGVGDCSKRADGHRGGRGVGRPVGRHPVPLGVLAPAHGGGGACRLEILLSACPAERPWAVLHRRDGGWCSACRWHAAPAGRRQLRPVAGGRGGGPRNAVPCAFLDGFGVDTTVSSAVCERHRVWPRWFSTCSCVIS